MDNTIEKFEPEKDLVVNSYKFHELGVEPIGNPTYEDWEAAFMFAKRSEKSVQFWIGDLLLQAEQTNFSDKISQVLEASDYTDGTIKNNKYVASNVHPEVRHPNLSFEAHKAVASLKPEDQIKWLDKVEEENLTVRELRQQLKGTPKKEDKKKQALIELEIAAKNFCDSIGVDREELGIIINDNELKLLKNGRFEKTNKEYLEFMFR